MADTIEAHLLRLKAGLTQRNRALVNEAAAALIEARAPLGQQWQAVSTALVHNGEINLALGALDALVEAARGSPNSRYLRAALLAQAGRLVEAGNELGALPPDMPDAVSNAYLKGTIALNRGDLQAAQAHLTQAVDLNPAKGQAWLALSEVVDLATHPVLHGRLEDAWLRIPEQAEDRATLAYAVGRVRHQRGDLPGAFEAFSQGAEAKLLSLGAPHSDSPAIVERSLSWSCELIERTAGRITADHSRVIFVTGLPRSGTTLVEQVLVSNPAVTAGEELRLFRTLAQEIGGLDADRFSAWLDRGGDPNALTQLYLHLASERLGGSGRFVDKTVEAGNYMGLLLALFPNAPIFWVRRDPIDNGWSAFRTYFARGADWSWDLESIGRRLAQEDQIFRFWSRKAPDRINVIEYESLVRDPEPNIRHIAEAAGLEPCEQMFRPHETRRVVATASVSQVREPINLKGIGVADPYREWLRPMIGAYRRTSVNAGSE